MRENETRSLAAIVTAACAELPLTRAEINVLARAYAETHAAFVAGSGHAAQETIATLRQQLEAAEQREADADVSRTLQAVEAVAAADRRAELFETRWGELCREMGLPFQRADTADGAAFAHALALARARNLAARTAASAASMEARIATLEERVSRLEPDQEAHG